MPVDELDRVRRANPVPGAPSVAPVERLLDRLDAARTPPRPRRRLVVRAALGLTAAAALAAALLTTTSGETDVLAAVYRNTTPGPGTLHMQWRTVHSTAGQVTSTQSVSVWSQPRLKRSRVISRYVDLRRGRSTFSESAGDGAVTRAWSSGRPGVIREQRAPAQRATDGVWDGGIGVMRFLYRNGSLEVEGRAGDGRWKLGGVLDTGERLTVLVTKAFVPSEIREQDGTSLTVTRYSIFRHEREDVRLDLPDHRGLPVVRSGTRRP